MDIEHFVKKESIIDLSFFNFSNAVTAAYFASSDLKVLKVNNNDYNVTLLSIQFGLQSDH